MDRPKLRKLGFADFLEIRVPVWPIVKTAFCEEVKERFKDNLWAVTGMKTIPGYSYWCGFHYGIAVAKVRERLRDVPEGPYKQRKINDEAWDIFMSTKMSPGDWDKHGGEMERLMDFDVNGHATLYRFMQSACVLTWGCIEVFLSDLLKGAMKLHPPQTPIKVPNSGSRPNVKARAAYLGWFELFFQDPGITTAINADAIYALGAIRHAIVHRAAHMDELFVKDVDGDQTKTPPTRGCQILKTHYPNPKEDDPLDLDGKFVRLLIDSAVRACFALLVAVDKWKAVQKP
jgi:hypothetical protein